MGPPEGSMGPPEGSKGLIRAAKKGPQGYIRGHRKGLIRPPRPYKGYKAIKGLEGEGGGPRERYLKVLHKGHIRTPLRGF